MIPAEVRVTHHVAPEAIEHLFEELRSFGLDPSRRDVARRRGIGDVPCAVWIGFALQPFFNTLVQSGAQDFYMMLKELLSGALKRRRQEDTTAMVLHDTETGRELVLDSDLPTQAYRELSRLDLSAFPKAGRIRYDRERRKWSPPDEKDLQDRSQGSSG